jgi:phosphinothricin acetyltransferase
MTIVEVRPAGSDDAAAVAAIFGHYVEHSTATFVETPPAEEEWQSRIEAATLPFLVATDGGEVVGFARLTQWRDKDAYRRTAEDAVYVAPTATGRGVGRALLDALIERAAVEGIREIVAVIAETGDEASMRLHLAAGFAERGRLTGVGHKQGKWLDTVLLQRSLR